MASILKKPARKQRKGAKNLGNKRAVRTRLSTQDVFSRAEDLAQRKKIGKTLEVAAFLAHHRRNSASAAHWES